MALKITIVICATLVMLALIDKRGGRKRINEYGKYSAVIAGKEHYLCVWCYKKTQRNNEILKGCNDDTKI